MRKINSLCYFFMICIFFIGSCTPFNVIVDVATATSVALTATAMINTPMPSSTLPVPPADTPTLRPTEPVTPINIPTSTTQPIPIVTIELTTELKALCKLDLRGDIPKTIPCDGGGQLVIMAGGENAHKPWIGTLSRIVVPNDWSVTLFYETWLADTGYTKKDPEKEGYVLLNSGIYHLPDPGYQVYMDINLTQPKRLTNQHELNDTVQLLIIRPSRSNNQLILSDNVQPPYGRELSISYQP